MRPLYLLAAFVALVPAAHAQPAAQRFEGAGLYCGAGFDIRLDWGDRATFQPPVVDMASTELRIGKHRVTITSGPGELGGTSIGKVDGADLRMGSEGKKKLFYVLDDGQPFALQITSPDFRGYAEDRWFFQRFSFMREKDQGGECLAEKTGKKD
jgi:hypothetical protein